MSTLRNVVLVHGGFVDGSGWQGVYESLTRDGFRVSVVQNPTLSLEGDAQATRQIIDAQDGPVVLVGHSYGGAVITEAGTDPNVAALVYVCAFAPDKGESVGSLIAGFPADGPQPRPGCGRRRGPVDTGCGGAETTPRSEKIKDLSAERSVVPRPQTSPRPQSGVSDRPSEHRHRTRPAGGCAAIPLTD
jgi:pimeloyl-ACP methyl ester carboxylesterase